MPGANFSNLAMAQGSKGVYIAFDEGEFKGATVMNWNGASWSYCGPREFTAPSTFYNNTLDLTVDGDVPYIVFLDSNNGYKLKVMEYR
jgi:hypothetical protein